MKLISMDRGLHVRSGSDAKVICIQLYKAFWFVDPVILANQGKILASNMIGQSHHWEQLESKTWLAIITRKIKEINYMYIIGCMSNRINQMVYRR